MEKFVKILKEKGLKITPQRLDIMSYLDVNRCHPDVDTIYRDLKEKNPSLSKTTVYNTLQTLKEKGVILELTISGSERRFDYDHGFHHHFQCLKCNRIIDMDIPCDYVNNISEMGHEVKEIHSYIKGICMDCLKEDQS